MFKVAAKMHLRLDLPSFPAQLPALVGGEDLAVDAFGCGRRRVRFD